tara:strand:+ start:921 stop:1118 length:198 start_codon:yes stop_codon:yes gene_type:complete
MRNRNLINKKLENLESTLINLTRIVNTQEPIESYKININRGLSLVDELRDMVESEPMDPREINHI